MRCFPNSFSAVALLAVSAASPSSAQGVSDGWITHPDAAQAAPIVLHFRRGLDLAEVAASLPLG